METYAWTKINISLKKIDKRDNFQIKIHNINKKESIAQNCKEIIILRNIELQNVAQKTVIIMQKKI